MTSTTLLPHPAPLSGASYSAVELMPGDREVALLDQRALPLVERYDRLERFEQVAEAIETLAVRGAPAIGIAAAYGMVLAAGAESGAAGRLLRPPLSARRRASRDHPTHGGQPGLGSRSHGALSSGEVAPLAPGERVARLAAEARAIHREDVEACRAMGQHRRRAGARTAR